MINKRRKFLIDWKVQGALVARVCGHWVALLAATVVALPLFRAICLGDIATPLGERLKSAGLDAGILTAIFVLLLPYFIYDTLRISNKFAGPMYRLHNTIRRLAEGQPTPPVNFRGDDFWQEVATDFNTMVERIRTDEGAAESARQDQEQEEELVAT